MNNNQMNNNHDAAEFDYVIVGAGSAGCVLANRLSADGKHSVLLLEAGPRDTNIWIHVPLGYGKLFKEKTVNWMYQTEPEPGLDGRQVFQPRGKVLGGSSSINGLLYVRGQHEDYDRWRQRGNIGWGFDDVLPYFKKAENQTRGADDYHGIGGPLSVSDWRHADPLSEAFVKAAVEAGIPFNPDFNGATQEGAGFFQTTTRRGRRASSAFSYLRPAKGRGNLHIETSALAQRLVFEGRRARAVEYRQNGALRTARARKEILVSSGAYNSPQLLQLSGVGPGDVLQRVGVPVHHESPAVGRYMQDHVCYDYIFKASQPSLNEDLYPWWGKLRVGLQYILTRKGPLSLSVNQGGGYFRSRPDLPRPNIQLYFSPLTYEKTPPGTKKLMRPDPYPGFITSVSPCRPTSRGHLQIVSPDPRAAPAIHPNYLSTDHDVAELLAGARFLCRLAAAPSLAGIIAEELKPGSAVRSDAERIADIRARAYSVFHPVGTCRMGQDNAQAVVDHRLRLHGLANRRCIDASIFPKVTSGNTNAPAMLVGEKGADLVLADAG